MKKLLIITAIFLMSCSSKNDFNKGCEILKQQGYTDIKNTGYDWFCCSQDDSFSTGFTAKDKNGNEIKGCMCSSILKGVTIRFK